MLYNCGMAHDTDKEERQAVIDGYASHGFAVEVWQHHDGVWRAQQLPLHPEPAGMHHPLQDDEAACPFMDAVEPSLALAALAAKLHKGPVVVLDGAHVTWDAGGGSVLAIGGPVVYRDDGKCIDEGAQVVPLSVVLSDLFFNSSHDEYDALYRSRQDGAEPPTDEEVRAALKGDAERFVECVGQIIKPPIAGLVTVESVVDGFLARV